jgi:hypothetical protein
MVKNQDNIIMKIVENFQKVLVIMEAKQAGLSDMIDEAKNVVVNSVIENSEKTEETIAIQRKLCTNGDEIKINLNDVRMLITEKSEEVSSKVEEMSNKCNSTNDIVIEIVDQARVQSIAIMHEISKISSNQDKMLDGVEKNIEISQENRKINDETNSNVIAVKELSIGMNKKMNEKFDKIVEKTDIVKKGIDAVENILNDSAENSVVAKEILMRIDIITEDIKKEVGSLGLQVISTWKEVNVATNKLYDIENLIENNEKII